MEARTSRSARDEEVVPLVKPLPRVVNTVKEESGGDRSPEGTMKDSETNEDKDTYRLHDVSRHVMDDPQVDHRSTIVLPAFDISKSK